MYEVDFLPVEAESGPGSKSGDAIAIRFLDSTGVYRVIVIDGGFTNVGDDLANHIARWYGTDSIDLVISTHPDADHINGLARLLEHMPVAELLLHQPRRHHPDVSLFSNIEAVDNLLLVASRRGVTVTEPFTGLRRFNDDLRILGPTESDYEALVAQHIEEVRTGAAAQRASAPSFLKALAADFLDRVVAMFPVETLTDEGDTGPRNDSSVITLINAGGQQLLFTGDAGIPALTSAAAAYEVQFGSFQACPLSFIQVPHHGSKRNVGPTILNRILGAPGAPYNQGLNAAISSAKADKKHPSPKVTNAFGRRGCEVTATEGRGICWPEGVPLRPGWTATPTVPPLDEAGDD